MNCSEWEERIALYAGGDLHPAEAAEVERHLGDCPGCRLFASDLKESLELLQDVHREPLAPAHFAAVRARVLAELESGRQPWWRKVWVYGLAAAAAALFLILAQRPATPRHIAVQSPASGNRSLRSCEKIAETARLTDESVCPTLPCKDLRPGGAGAFACQPIFSQLLTVAALPALRSRDGNGAVGTPHKSHRKRAPAAAHTDPGPPIVVKLLTDDPDVVIYWITDKSGE
jgi:hypothetical protein